MNTSDTTTTSVTSEARPICLVTGATGFVGKALCRRLLQLGFEVRAISRSKPKELKSLGVSVYIGNIGDGGAFLDEALKGVESVFHVAAKVDMWGKKADFIKANIKGTENLLQASLRAGVSQFVFTSSPSVIATGKDLHKVDESTPYPDHYDAYYPETKAAAERLVLSADGLSGDSGVTLRTLSLRPHLIWGPGDTNLLPTIIERARAGKLIQIGNGDNLVDVTYIDDCVSAHVCAMTALKERPEDAAGKAYFISQGEPTPLWGFINEVLLLSDLPRISRGISHKVAQRLSTVCELWARLTRSSKPPLLTRFLVDEMATHHYFDISAAKTRLGFTPEYSIKEGLEITFGRAEESAESNGLQQSGSELPLDQVV